MMTKPLNTRIAPSPTGDMHFGTARTAYFNFLAARSTGGTFLMRIDDTDLVRSDKHYIQVIRDTMDWLDLKYDKIVYQSKRKKRYAALAETLIGFGNAIRLEDGAVQFILNSDLINAFKDNVYPTKWHDEIVGDVAITEKDLEIIDGMIIMKSNGMPTYNWATVVDDHDYDINFVIRGQDHLSNTAKQVILFSALGAPIPMFAHVGLIHQNKKKLSKRDQSASMLWYRDQGYDPDAVLNCMARLGWGPTVDDKTTKILPRERMLELFLDGGKMKSSPANLDIAKLDSFNRKYIARKERENATANT